MSYVEKPRPAPHLPPCKYLEPAHGWRDDWRGAAPDKMLNDEPLEFLDYNCGWADQHPDRFLSMPQWLQREVMNAPGYRRSHCKGCRCYQPELPTGNASAS